MFAKMLKYDLKSVWKTWRIFALITFILGLAVIADIKLMTNDAFWQSEAPAMDMLRAFCIIFAITSFCCVIAFELISIFYPLKRFYSNMFTDEGYLTFTLPLSREKIYLSKTINTIIWSVASGAVLSVLALLMMLFIPRPEPGHLVNTYVFEGISVAIKELQEVIGGGWFWLYAFEGLIIGIATEIMYVGIFNICITIGSIVAKKHKIGAAVGIYYGVSTVFSVAYNIFVFLMMTAGQSTIIQNIALFSEVKSKIFLSLLLLLIFAAIAGIGVFIHVLSMKMIEKKLNLS